MHPDSVSAEVKRILVVAQQESEKFHHYYLGVEHLFIALTKNKSGVTQRVLRDLNINPKQFRDSLRDFIGQGDGHRYWDGIVITPRCQIILGQAREESENLGKELIDEKSLLNAIFKEGEGIPIRVLEGLGFQTQMILEMINDSTLQVEVNTGPVSAGEQLVHFSIEKKKFTSGGRNN